MKLKPSTPSAPVKLPVEIGHCASGAGVVGERYNVNGLYDASGECVAQLSGVPLHTILSELRGMPRFAPALKRAEYIRDCLNQHESLLTLARKLAAMPSFCTNDVQVGEMLALIAEARVLTDQDSSRCGPQGSTSDPKST